MDPNNATYLSNRAIALLKLKKAEEAILDCKKALELDPKFARVSLFEYHLSSGYNKVLL